MGWSDRGLFQCNPGRKERRKESYNNFGIVSANPNAGQARLCSANPSAGTILSFSQELWINWTEWRRLLLIVLLWPNWWVIWIETRVLTFRVGHTESYREFSFCITNPTFSQLCGGHWPPLWSSGQSSWLLTQKSRVRFPALPDFLRSSGSGTGSTQPLWG
jgi:hypothetical protein